MDQHDLICKLKELALELGCIPNRQQFLERHGFAIRSKIEAAFGGFAAFKQAAGLVEKKPEKITNAVFNRDIEQHLEAYEPRKVEILPYPTIAVISDVHRPFQLERVVNRFLEYVGDTKPEWVVENGDGRDQFSSGRFPRSANVFTPREEQALSRKQHEEFWSEVIHRSPKSKCRLMMGNHDTRVLRQVLEHLPSVEDWVRQALQKDMTFPGVETIFDTREELKIGNILIFHGYRSKLGDHTAYTQSNCITGHSHQGGLVFRMGRWELNSGYAGDPEAKGLTYTQQKLSNWTHGFGAVDSFGPRFIPA